MTNSLIRSLAAKFPAPSHTTGRTDHGLREKLRGSRDSASYQAEPAEQLAADWSPTCVFVPCVEKRFEMYLTCRAEISFCLLPGTPPCCCYCKFLRVVENPESSMQLKLAQTGTISRTSPWRLFHIQCTNQILHLTRMAHLHMLHPPVVPARRTCGWHCEH
ncbi:uncharacterized protein BKA78DRAFT_323946 [Phyllosticta capitalensis]|uniref:uncharacterized protein n=1 Tax=Phyllosticta capitalensis TaxID=121624 RepID=UPI003130A25E